MRPGSSVARGQQEMKTPAMGLGGSMSGGCEKARAGGYCASHQRIRSAEHVLNVTALGCSCGEIIPAPPNSLPLGNSTKRPNKKPPADEGLARRPPTGRMVTRPRSAGSRGAAARQTDRPRRW